MKLFSNDAMSPCIIGVVHLLPLPGSPGWHGDMGTLLHQAELEARTYLEAGVDALLVENMHDAPYLKGTVAPETTAAMAVAAQHVKQAASPLPVGAQILAGANLEALGVAVAAGLDFIRVEAFAYAHVADEGILEACAGELLRARANLHAQSVAVLADIKKKHSSHAITEDLHLGDVAEGTEFCGADGIIVTGPTTGKPPAPATVSELRESTRLPLLVGSGVTVENVRHFLDADGLIVGSHFKEDGLWSHPVSAVRVGGFMEVLEKLRVRST